MLPERGSFIGAMTKKFAPPCSLRWRTASMSARPPSVSFATTRTSAMELLLPRAGGDRARGSRLGRRLEDPVDRAGDAVLVGRADDGRDLVEVEDRRWRGHLPLERQRAPWVGHGDRAAAPARDHVVEEDEEAQPERERRHRDREVPV